MLSAGVSPVVTWWAVLTVSVANLTVVGFLSGFVFPSYCSAGILTPAVVCLMVIINIVLPLPISAMVASNVASLGTLLQAFVCAVISEIVKLLFLRDGKSFAPFYGVLIKNIFDLLQVPRVEGGY